MIAVDTNVLVYAHRQDSPWHESARRCAKRLAEGCGAWAIPWTCLHEFLAIVTHPRIFAPPSALPDAIEQIDAWLESPTLIVLTETDLHWSTLKALLSAGRIQGPQVHDARIAALCAQHGVRELWSADRDFNRFPSVTVLNPLVSKGS